MHRMSTKHLMPQYEERALTLPNLPQSKVACVAVNASAGETVKKIRTLGIDVIEIQPDLRLPKPVNSHADIQLLHVGENGIFCHRGFKCTGERMSKFSFTEIADDIGNEYPHDVLLNCTFIGDKLICNSHTVAPEVLQFADSHGYTLIPVKQGYARCSVCVADNNAIITDDKSIFTAAQNFLNDVLFISKGSVRLSGYNYGFIGGCCGKLDEKTVAFNGVVESHSDHNAIYDFMERNHLNMIELTSQPLTDIGGIIPLTESVEQHL